MMLVSRSLVALCLVLGCAGLEARAFDCVEKYCSKMESCAEAHHHFAVCGEQARDGDYDGIPCENVCGTTPDEYRRLRGSDAAQPRPPPSQPADPPQPAEPPTHEHGLAPPSAESPALQCGGKRKCGQMLSCDEARFYLSSCGVRSLDRDGDGVPCESLCGGR